MKLTVLLLFTICLTAFQNSDVLKQSIEINTDKLLYFAADSMHITIANHSADTVFGTLGSIIYEDTLAKKYLYDIRYAGSSDRIKTVPDTFMPNSTKRYDITASQVKPADMRYITLKITFYQKGIDSPEIFSEKLNILSDW